MGDVALTIGMSVGIAGATAAMKLEACNQIPDINPYEECISSCDNYKNDKEDYAKCINENRCNDVDPDTNEKIHKNINLREKCKKDALSNESMEYDMLSIMITKELIEGVLINTLAYKLGSKQLLKKAGLENARIFAKQFAKQSAKAGAKVGAKVGAAAAAGAARKKVTGVIVAFLIRKVGKRVLQNVAKALLRTLAVGLGILSVLDGVSIALDIWDPAGFALVPTNKDIKTMRDAYINSNKSQLDNKMWNSELYQNKKYEIEKDYELYKAIYSTEKTESAKQAMNDSKKKLDEINKLIMFVKFRGSERPREHGGILVFPFEAFPKYPFDDDGEFMNGKLEELYYKYIREYVTNQGDLVWTEKELNELIEIQKQKEAIEKKKNNLANKSTSDLKEDVKEDLEKSNLLKNKIKSKEQQLEQMIKDKKLPEQIEEEKKKLEDLKNIKSNVDKNIDTNKSIISGETSKNEIIQQRAVRTNQIPAQQTTLSRNTVIYIVIFCFCIVVLFMYIRNR